MKAGCPWPHCQQPSARYGVRWGDGILCAQHSDEAATIRAEAQEEDHDRGRPC